VLNVTLEPDELPILPLAFAISHYFLIPTPSIKYQDLFCLDPSSLFFLSVERLLLSVMTLFLR
jgi:hypothetical protein